MQIHIEAGEHLSTAAKRLAAAAQEHGTAQCKFNEINLTANAGDTPEAIELDYDRQSHERSVAYLRSEEYQQYKARRAAKVRELQFRHDALMAHLPDLDWSNDAAVMDWICAMQEPSDHIGVKRSAPEIVKIFADHGFEKNAFTGPLYDGESREIVFRYIVGQALDGLSHIGAIHGLVHSFADRWRAKFAAPAPSA